MHKKPFANRNITPIQVWLFCIVFAVYLIFSGRNGWTGPSIYWLTAHSPPNIIDRVDGGTIEILIPSGEAPRNPQISPNSEWLWINKADNLMLFVNLLTREELEIELPIKYKAHTSFWLDSETVLLDNSRNGDFVRFNFKIGEYSEPIPYHPGSDLNGMFVTEDLPAAKKHIKNAQEIYVLAPHSPRASSGFILRLDEEKWEVYQPDLHKIGQLLYTLYEEIPDHAIYIGLVRYTNFGDNRDIINSPEKLRYYSPNGSLYASWDSQNTYPPRQLQVHRLSIYEAATDQQIAYVEKRILGLQMLGWSADNRTIYFNVDGRIRADASPIFAFHLDE